MLSLPRFAVADVHRFAALAGTVLVVMHVAPLLADPYAQLRLSTPSCRSWVPIARCGRAWAPWL